MTIGEVARASCLSPKTIRFYEDAGLLRAARRSASGYRLYGEAELARLRLLRRLRLLGLDLPAVRSLVDQAFDADCARFGEGLIASLNRQKDAVERQLRELAALREELDALERHVRHCCEGCDPAQSAAQCGFCGLILEKKGGDQDGPSG